METHIHPALLRQARQPTERETCIPGERIIAGRASIFDADLRADWLACMVKVAAQDADLSTLSDDALDGLSYDGIRIAALSKGADRVLSLQVQAERARRGQDSMGRPLGAAVLARAEAHAARHLLAAEEAAAGQARRVAA